MDNYKIRISGRKKLSGTVRVSGAKNASLPELAATILTGSRVSLHGIPDVKDVNTMLTALEAIGSSGSFSGNRVEINFSDIREPVVSEAISKTSRSSILILGPLLARNGSARVSLPGGCNIGDRQINFHLEGLERIFQAGAQDVTLVTGSAAECSPTFPRLRSPCRPFLPIGAGIRVGPRGRSRASTGKR